MVRAVARSNWPHFVLGVALAAVAAVTACDDDESNVAQPKAGDSAGAAGEGGARIGAGASDGAGGAAGGAAGSAGTSSADSRIPDTDTTSVFDVVPPSEPPGMSIVVAHEVSRSPSYTLVGTVGEVSADRMSSPNYRITLGVSQ
jgi:hypothetical protein